MSRPCESCSAPATDLVYGAALCLKCARIERAALKAGLGIPCTMEAAPEVFNLALTDARVERVEAVAEPVLSQPSLFEA